VLAVVRLFAGVRASMYSQGAPLDEALPAVRVVALVRPFICVYPIMSLQIRLAVEAFTTPFPITLKGASRGGFVVDNLHDFHLWRLLGILVPSLICLAARGSVRGRAGTRRLRTFSSYKSVFVSPPGDVGCGELASRENQAARLASACGGGSGSTIAGPEPEVRRSVWLTWFGGMPERDLP